MKGLGYLLCRIGFHRWDHATIIDHAPGANVGRTYNWCKRKNCPKFHRAMLVDEKRLRV